MFGKNAVSPGLCTIMLLTILLVACQSSEAIRELEILSREAMKDKSVDDGTHIIFLEKMYEYRVSHNQHRELIYFLEQFSSDFPNDPYQVYLTYLIAQTYENLGEHKLATLSYNRAIRSGPDVVVEGKSIHYLCIQALLLSEKNLLRRISLYEELLSRHGTMIDRGSIYYYLGELYEKGGFFQKSIGAFTHFLEYPGTAIPGRQLVHQQVREKLSLYSASRDWSLANRDLLVQEIRKSIRARDVQMLMNLQAKVNFFSISWLQEKSDFNSVIAFDIGRFSINTVNFSDHLEYNSNDQEAYLKTWGWSTYIPIWYLYFRKVDFPADAEFNGTWEWAGVYFGDTLQELPLNRGL